MSSALGALGGAKRRLIGRPRATHELDDTLLADVPVVDLLTLPIASLADRWRR